MNRLLTGWLLLLAFTIGLVSATSFSFSNKQTISISTTWWPSSWSFGVCLSGLNNGSELLVWSVTNTGNAFTAINYAPNGAGNYIRYQQFVAIPANITAKPTPVTCTSCSDNSGQTFILGSGWHQTGGAFHVLTWDMPANVSRLNATYTNPTPDDCQFASTMACTDNLEYISVYCRQWSYATGNKTHVYVYKRDAPGVNSWSLNATYDFDTIYNGDSLNQAIGTSPSGHVIAFGYTRDLIRICRFGDCQSVNISTSDGYAGFGTLYKDAPYSIDVDPTGDLVAYGDPNWAPGPGNVTLPIGRSYVLRYDSTSGLYSHRNTLYYPDENIQKQGFCLAFSSNQSLVVGAPASYTSASNQGAAVVFSHYDDDLWIPSPTPIQVIGTGLTTSWQMGSSVFLPSGQPGNIFLGAPVTGPPLDKGTVQFYNNALLNPAPTLPALPALQFIPPITNLRATTSGQLRGLASSSDGSSIMAIQLRMDAFGTDDRYSPQYYQQDTTSGYYVLDALPLNDNSAYGNVSSESNNTFYFPTCVNDNVTVLVVGLRSVTFGPVVNVWTSTLAVPQPFFSAVTQRIQQPAGRQSFPQYQWMDNMLCSTDGSTIMVTGFSRNASVEGTIDVFTRVNSTYWQLNYTTNTGFTTLWFPNAIALSRSGAVMAYWSQSSGTIEVKYVANASSIQALALPTLDNATVCSLALDYNAHQVAAGFCLANNSLGAVYLYRYSSLAPLTYNTTPTILVYTDAGASVGQGSALSFSGENDAGLTLLSVMPYASSGSGSVLVWQAGNNDPIGNPDGWFVLRILESFDNGGAIGSKYPSGGSFVQVYNNFLSVDGTTASVMGSNGVLVFKDVNEPLPPPPTVPVDPPVAPPDVGPQPSPFPASPPLTPPLPPSRSPEETQQQSVIIGIVSGFAALTAVVTVFVVVTIVGGGGGGGAATGGLISTTSSSSSYNHNAAIL